MCLNDEIISEYIDGELQDPWKTQLEEHLDWCTACKQRYDELMSVKTRMADSVLEEDDIKSRQDRVLRYITANVLHKKSKFKLFVEKIENLIKMPLKRIAVPALAAGLTFCFCLIFFNQSQTNEIINPSNIDTSISIENITPVRLTDNYTTQETLDKYSLDDILKYLDESGYDVSISVKSIKPIEQGEVIKNDYKSLLTINPPVPAGFQFGLSNKSYFTFKGNL